jgi:pimeloyl-ACP methyl ester carboxylesterase
MPSSPPPLTDSFPRGAYARHPRLILVNGLAEQAESWYEILHAWQQVCDVHMPALLVYDGPVMQQRLLDREPISVGFFVDRLETYLDQFVQAPPYHLVGSSLGGQVVAEYAMRHPDKVERLVLLCPSGMGSEERLPVLESFRHHDFLGLVESTFHNRERVDQGVVEHYKQKFSSRAWRRAFFETVRGTKSHSVAPRLSQISSPTLVICGENDAIVDPIHVRDTVSGLAGFRFEMIPSCGHAPQLECPAIVYELISQFFNWVAPSAMRNHSGLAPT